MTLDGSAYHHGDLRAALLAEAAAMIDEGGTSSVTMRAIGRRLGVSRSAPYRHFADKSALLVAVAAAGFDRLRDRLEAVAAGASGARIGRLRRVGEEYVRFALENPGHYRLMYGKEAITREDRPELREAANALFDELVRIVQTHQQGGTIKRQDPHLQAYVAWGAVHGLASLLIEGQILTAVDVDGLIRQTTSTLLEGMRAD
ncbi:MAG: TetR/AcrR family transcriptional regulator [Gammaproteobacteria bacterium]|nr:TetR/AcrR family transcriptional regulator [Gammaproteobacteria bacterium]MDE0258757.1 TetR/AcrR family transcriptional regulator [Gammaproteobacteria bacterium]